MTRAITLCTGQWADRPPETRSPIAEPCGFDGLEPACFGDHFEVDKALADPDYCAHQRTILEQNGVRVFSITNHLVGQAVRVGSTERGRPSSSSDGLTSRRAAALSIRRSSDDVQRG